MTGRYSRNSPAPAFLLALFASGSLCLFPPAAHAAGGAGDRLGETIIATGPVLVLFDEASKAAIPLDALYILDYKSGRLRASLPTFRQSTASTTIIESFLDRDLATDFKIDLDRGPRPHFLMTTGSLGPFTAGWAPLYVIETATNQLGVYRLNIQTTPGRSGPSQFELLQTLHYFNPTSAKEPEARPAALSAGQTIMTTGPVLVRYDEGTKAPIPLDALYILAYDGGSSTAWWRRCPPSGKRPRRQRSSNHSSSATSPPISSSTSIADNARAS